VAKLAIGFAVALIALGVGGYFAAAAEARSLTALIPAIAGGLLLICGLLAMNPAIRMHAMHGAAMVGLLGFLAPLGRLIPQAIKGTPPSPQQIPAGCPYHPRCPYAIDVCTTVDPPLVRVDRRRLACHVDPFSDGE